MIVDSQRLLLSMEETAAAMGICTKYLGQLVRSGEIPHVPLGRRKMFRPATVAAWLAEREQRGNTVGAQGPSSSGSNKHGQSQH